MQISVSSRTLHCWLLALIVFIVIFLTMPLLIIYLQDLNYEKPSQPFIASTTDKNANCTEFAYEKNLLLADDHIKCPRGTFPCNSCPNICIEQRRQCDHEPDCPDKSDESSCHDSNGALAAIYRKMDQNATKSSFALSAPADRSSAEVERSYGSASGNTTRPVWADWALKPDSCTDKQFDQFECPCVLTDSLVILCDNEQPQLQRVPNTLRSSVVKINLSNNNISSLDDVLWPRALVSLYLVNNIIERIGPRTFEQMPRLLNLFLNNNRIRHIDSDAFLGARNLRWLQIESNLLTTFNASWLRHTPAISRVHLSDNQIELPEDTMFSHCYALQNLHLDHNRISIVRAHYFSNMSSLNWLSLSDNQITHIEDGAFNWSYELEELNLANNKIKYIRREMFARSLNLQRLYLGANVDLITLPSDAFCEVAQLKSLDLTEIDFEYMPSDVFSSCLTQLQFIYFSKLRYCGYASHVRACTPKTDGVSSRDRLLEFPIFRCAVWVVACVCTLGNVLVFVWRTISSREARDSLFIKNLSFADLMMGIYLASIGVQDLKFEHLRQQRRTYDGEAYVVSTKAIEWMSSWNCTAIGFLAMLSSETSVFILTIITIERYRCIMSGSPTASDEKKQNRRARVYITLAWILALLIASFPLLQPAWQLYNANSYDSGNTSSNNNNNNKGDMSGSSSSSTAQSPPIVPYSTTYSFYADNDLCLPLHIHSHTFSRGWWYSTFVYLVVNLGAVLLIAGLYAHMYSTIMSGRQRARPSALFKHQEGGQREDALLAMRFFFIVVTYCLCWIPIVVIKIVAMFNVRMPFTIYAWLVVFIIPINSALNPIVYTLVASKPLRDALCRAFARLYHHLSALLGCYRHITAPLQCQQQPRRGQPHDQQGERQQGQREQRQRASLQEQKQRCDDLSSSSSPSPSPSGSPSSSCYTTKCFGSYLFKSVWPASSASSSSSSSSASRTFAAAAAAAAASRRNCRSSLISGRTSTSTASSSAARSRASTQTDCTSQAQLVCVTSAGCNASAAATVVTTTGQQQRAATKASSTAKSGCTALQFIASGHNVIGRPRRCMTTIPTLKASWPLTPAAATAAATAASDYQSPPQL